MTTDRLEYLRGEIRAERISWGEIAELQSLAAEIDDGDMELLEWAGVCETCATGHWERAHFTGTPIFVHADGTREVYYECDCGRA